VPCMGRSTVASVSGYIGVEGVRYSEMLQAIISYDLCIHAWMFNDLR